MMSSLAISDAVLAFSSTFAVFLMAQRKTFAEIHRLSANCAMLGFLLMAMASTVGSLRYGISESWAGPHDMLMNVAVYLSPPLAGIAICLGLTTRSWSGAAWGRVILGVCAVYEVSRWYGLDIIYRDLQMVMLVVCITYLAIRSSSASGPRWLIIASIFSYFIGALVIGTQGTFAGYLRLDLFRYLIGLGNLLLSSGMYLTMKNSYSHIEE
ncbi:hypothetical protein ACH42_02330 [Endozoicomonas sp. (ex Bugula neritina AB1)]|nr:hypothetical protein ACH42_02330 [Endozoicomonas sp. (ex Bugula neritina AB1)]